MLPSCLKLVADARKSVNEVSWEALSAEDPDSYFLVDVREPHEFAERNVPHALNVPRGLLEFSIHDHPELRHLKTDELLDARFYLLCGTGGRSALAALSMEALGFRRVCSIAGGLKSLPDP